jgi:hypothetical protein
MTIWFGSSNNMKDDTLIPQGQKEIDDDLFLVDGVYFSKEKLRLRELRKSKDGKINEGHSYREYKRKNIAEEKQQKINRMEKAKQTINSLREKRKQEGTELKYSNDLSDFFGE